MKNVMLDLETMGNGHSAAIIAIGAVEFDAEKNSILRRFYSTVSLDSAVASGGVIDPSTVIWWMGQSDEARAEFKRAGTRIDLALKDFSEFLSTVGQSGSINIWGNGAAFDNVIISSAYKRSAIERPWTHLNDRCYRTVKSMFPEITLSRSGTFHKAVDDAETQANHLMEILSHIRSRGKP